MVRDVYKRQVVVLAAAVFLSVPTQKFIASPGGELLHVPVVPYLHSAATLGLVEALVTAKIGVIIQGVVIIMVAAPGGGVYGPDRLEGGVDLVKV